MPGTSSASTGIGRTVAAVAVVVALYIASQVGYALLDSPTKEPKPVAADRETSVVLVRVIDIQTVQGLMTLAVNFYPAHNLVDERTGVLTDDVTLHLASPTDTAVFEHPAGELVSGDTSKDFTVSGDPDDWPFDRYHTGPIELSAWSGTGAASKRLPVRVEVDSYLHAWDVDVRHSDSTVTIDANRTRSALLFDLGICLLLLSLPVTGLFVAVNTVRGRRQFLPPMTTWFAAMVFAIVPLRSVLPGAPPPGAWIDEILILWVFLGLGTAMLLYVVAWWRQTPTADGT